MRGPGRIRRASSSQLGFYSGNTEREVIIKGPGRLGRNATGLSDGAAEGAEVVEDPTDTPPAKRLETRSLGGLRPDRIRSLQTSGT